jgi:hypothetical protein
MRIWPYEVFVFMLATDFLRAVKPYDTEPPALLPFRRKVLCGFLSPLKSSPLPGMKPRTLCSVVSY